MQIAIITIVISVLFLIAGLCIGFVIPAYLVATMLINRDRLFLELIERATRLKLIKPDCEYKFHYNN